MPFIELKTNINVNQNLKEEAFEFLNDHISILSGKNKERLMINIIDNQNMMFKGDKSPLIMIEVKTYLEPSKQDLDKLTLILSNYFSNTFNIPIDRIYVSYFPLENWGYAGYNF